MSNFRVNPARVSVPVKVKGLSSWKGDNEILPYSLAHQQNHERCKELYPDGFSYVGGTSGTIGFGKGKGNTGQRRFAE